MLNILNGLMMLRQYKFIFSFTLFFLLFNTTNTNAALYRKGFGTKIFDRHLGSTVGLGPVKSWASIYFDFNKNRRKSVVQRELNKENSTFINEAKFYASQFKKTLTPSYLLFEFNLFPVTIAGSLFKSKASDSYHKFDFQFGDKNYNVVDILATRYDRPYSYTVFLGEIIPYFSKKNDDKKTIQQSGSSIMGYLLSYGPKKTFKLIEKENHWLQLSYKIKGKTRKGFEKKGWTFEAGYLKNSNNLFFDALTFYIVRDRSSMKDHSFFSNLKLEWFFNLPMKKYDEIKQSTFTTYQKIVIGKQIPYKKYLIGLEFGFKWERYKISRSSTETETNYFLIPTIKW
jgi:hypothetical protein